VTLYDTKSSNIRKTWLVFSLFLIVIIGVGWAISYYYNDSTILYIAVAFSLLMNVTAYWRSDKIVLSMNRAHEADPREFRELHNIVENLAITAGLPKPKIYVIQDASPNAFATGRNPQHAAVAVTTGLLQRLNRTELEGVLAHELAHVKNYDTLLQTIVVILVGFIAIASDIFLRSMWFGGGRSQNNNDRGQAGGILMLVGIVLSPIIAVLIQLAISRKREFLADASGALLTRYPEGLASALEKISSAPPLARAKNATAHLFFVNPFKADTGANKKRAPWLAKLFMTHPPVEERIAALKGEKI
jgi:heat shock protein HtpX